MGSLNYRDGVKPGRIDFSRPLTEEEIRQLLRERDERLDPANRPTNAEVNNTEREWDYDHDDFKDMVGRRPAVPHLSTTGPAVERPASLRTMGIGLLIVCLFFLWLTWAFFSKSFTSYDDVRLTASKSGLSLPNRADVKLRGMIVGVVREVHVSHGRVVMTLGMDPKLIDRVPADVRADIIPKTLFGEKYIDLVPTGSGSGEHLRAGDTISDASVPIEVDKFFNDVYPILVAVPPAKVAYTLTALADTLQGRGESLGVTLDETNDYLKKINPDTQQAVDDIVSLGKVSDSYADQMDDFGTLLKNTAKVSRTVHDKRKDLVDFFDETDDLSDVLRDFLAASGDDIVATVHNSVQPLKISKVYSSMFPCWFKGLDYFLRNDMDSILKNGTLHIDLRLVSPQATEYDVATERPILREIDSAHAAASEHGRDHVAIGDRDIEWRELVTRRRRTNGKRLRGDRGRHDLATVIARVDVQLDRSIEAVIGHRDERVIVGTREH